MLEGEPQQIHHIKLEVGQALLVSVIRPDYEKRNPNLLEEVRVITRRTADSMVAAMGGDPSLCYDLEVDYGRMLDRLGRRLHQADIPVGVVFREAKSVYRGSRMGNADNLIDDLAGYFADRLSYSPKEAA